MRLVVVLMFMSLMFGGCGLLKDKQRHREKLHKVSIEKGVRIIKIPRDSLVYVPNVIIKRKDTTITVENKHIALKITSRNKQISKIKAIQKPQEEKTEYERTEQTDKKETNTQSKGFELKPVWILYLFLGLGFLILVNNFTKRK